MRTGERCAEFSGGSVAWTGSGRRGGGRPRFSGTARGNVLFVGVSVPLPVLEAGAPGTVVEISSEPLASALAMPTDPGFVPRFLARHADQERGSQARRRLYQSRVPGADEDSYSPVPGTTPVRKVQFPARHRAPSSPARPSTTPWERRRSVASETPRAAPDRASEQSSRQPPHRGSAFESTASAFLSEVVIGPVVLRGLSYSARAVANGSPGGAAIERSSAVEEITVNGQRLAGPLDLANRLPRLGCWLRSMPPWPRAGSVWPWRAPATTWPMTRRGCGLGSVLARAAGDEPLAQRGRVLPHVGHLPRRARACLNLSVRTLPSRRWPSLQPPLAPSRPSDRRTSQVTDKEESTMTLHRDKTARGRATLALVIVPVPGRGGGVRLQRARAGGRGPPVLAPVGESDRRQGAARHRRRHPGCRPGETAATGRR